MVTAGDVALVAGADVMVAIVSSDVDAATSGSTRAAATDNAHNREQLLAIVYLFSTDVASACWAAQTSLFEAPLG